MNNFTMPDKKYFLFAARRADDQLILVVPKSGERFLMNEELLRRDYNVQLGDFLHCKINRSKELYDISKTKHTANISTVVNGDEAIIENLRADLVSSDELLLFQSQLFDDIRCWQSDQPIGRYYIKMRLFPTSREMSGRMIHYEVVKITGSVKSIELNKQQGNFQQNIDSGYSAASEKTESSAGFSQSPAAGLPSPQNLIYPAGSKKIVSQQGTQVVGPGCPLVKKEETPANKIMGTGFPKSTKREENVFGSELLQQKKNNEKPGSTVGKGFTTSQTIGEKQRAVVTSIDAKRPGTYYLWNLDSKTEGLLKSTTPLELGHQFAGIFVNQENGKCFCKEYIGEIERVLEGKVNDTNKVNLTVKLLDFQPAGVNRRRASGTAKYIGDVLEGNTEDTKLTIECIGKKVNIERRKFGEKDFVWMVTEIRNCSQYDQKIF